MEKDIDGEVAGDVERGFDLEFPLGLIPRNGVTLRDWIQVESHQII